MKVTGYRATARSLTTLGLALAASSLLLVSSVSAQSVIGYWRAEGVAGSDALQLTSSVVPAGATAANVTAVLVDAGDGSLSGGTNTQVMKADAVQFSSDTAGAMIFDPLTNTTVANTTSVHIDQAGRPFATDEFSDDAHFQVNSDDGDSTLFKLRNFTYELFVKSVATQSFGRIASIRRGDDSFHLPGGSPVTAWSLGPFGTEGSQTYGIRADSRDFPYFLPGDGNGLANDSGTSSVLVNDSVWHHVAITYEDGVRGTTPGQFTLYVDYQLVQTFKPDGLGGSLPPEDHFALANNGTVLYGDTNSDPPDTVPFALTGIADDIFAASLDGFVDEMRYTDQVLTPAQFLQIVSAGNAADYNGNGIVDAADYTVWRDSEGQMGSGLDADGNNDLVVDQLDYDLWVANFGAISATATTVPEPTSLALVLTMVLFAGKRRTSRDA